MAVRSGGPAPYAPPQTIMSLIRAYRNRGLSVPFNPEVLVRAGVPDSLVARTLHSLRLLDLIDPSGNPTPELDGLRRAGEAEFPQRLADIIRQAYADVFQFVDPAKDDTTRVRDAFRAYEPLGQLTRMVTLFLGLCEAAAIIPEGTRKTPTPSGRPSPKKGTQKQSSDGGRGSHRPASVKYNVRADDGTGIIPEPVLGLVRAIPLKGWTQKRRDNFIATFGHVLDFSVPILDSEPVEGEAEEAEE